MLAQITGRIGYVSSGFEAVVMKTNRVRSVRGNPAAIVRRQSMEGDSDS